MYNLEIIYEFLSSALASGQRTTLVTVIAVTGASSRNPGAHMAVAEDGSYVGSFSSGCIEAAVVAEAIDASRAKTTREVRFGADSPYIDIRLPCGGSVDLLFSPISDSNIVAQTIGALRARRPVSVCLPRRQGTPHSTSGGEEWSIIVSADAIELTYIPILRVVIFGHSGEVEALQCSATAYGAACEIFTPEKAIVDRVVKSVHPPHFLQTPATPIAGTLDLWTAAIFLFHDHDWEPLLLKAALAQPSFFVGAMGSRITHEYRLERLRELSVSDADLDRIVAPIGLIPSSRDPQTLALSVLAQVVTEYHRRFYAKSELNG